GIQEELIMERKSPRVKFIKPWIKGHEEEPQGVKSYYDLAMGHSLTHGKVNKSAQMVVQIMEQRSNEHEVENIDGQRTTCATAENLTKAVQDLQMEGGRIGFSQQGLTYPGETMDKWNNAQIFQMFKEKKLSEGQNSTSEISCEGSSRYTETNDEINLKAKSMENVVEPPVGSFTHLLQAPFDNDLIECHNMYLTTSRFDEALSGKNMSTMENEMENGQNLPGCTEVEKEDKGGSVSL
ncbi:hypothetical protein EJB05_51386, partial [Eragrostis curvula]